MPEKLVGEGLLLPKFGKETNYSGFLFYEKHLFTKADSSFEMLPQSFENKIYNTIQIIISRIKESLPKDNK